jgi:hypothetical protein
MDFKRISEILAFAVPVLVLCSCINLWTYYSHWDIPIFDYLSAAELLFLFTQPLLIISALALLYFGANFAIGGAMFLAIKSGLVRKGGKEENKSTTQEPERRSRLVIWIARSRIFAAVIRTPMFDPVKTRWTWFWINRYKILAAILGSIPILMIGWYFVQSIWFEYDTLSVVIFHVFLLFASVAIIHKYSAVERDNLSLETFIAGTIIMLLSASFFYGRYKAHDTDLHSISYRLVLKDNSVTQTDENLIYLGKTGTYYFLFNKAENAATVVSVGEVKSATIKKGN